MRAFIKYFDDGWKNISFKNEVDDIFLKYNKIWNKIETLNIKFHNQRTYEEKYIKKRKKNVKTFNGVTHTVFSDNEIPNKRNSFTCIAAISISFVMKID